jgi:hypothetical protein
VAPHLEKSQAKLLDPLLKDPDTLAVMSVTRILWDRFGSDRGAVELISRLATAGADDKNRDFTFGLSYTLHGIRTDAVAAGLAGLLASKNIEVRMEAYRVAASFPHPLPAAALAAQLEDRTPTGWTGQFAFRFCDQAALTLAAMAGLKERFTLKGDEAERDRIIAGLHAWWLKEGGSVDWKKLRAQIEDAERDRSVPQK